MSSFVRLNGRVPEHGYDFIKRMTGLGAEIVGCNLIDVKAVQFEIRLHSLKVIFFIIMVWRYFNIHYV